MLCVPGATSNYVRNQGQKFILRTAQQPHILLKLKENKQ